MAEEKFIPGINVGDLVRVTRGGQVMTGVVVRNDASTCEINRDDVPAFKEYHNPKGYRYALRVEHTPQKIHIFGTGNADVRVEKIA